MDPKTHCEKIYCTKAPTQVGWYSPHLETSLALIHRAAGANSASIIDVGPANLRSSMTFLREAMRTSAFSISRKPQLM